MKMPSYPAIRVLSVLAILAAATATPQPSKTTTTSVTLVPTPPPGQCAVGSLLCCNSVQDASSSAVQALLKDLDIAPGDVTGDVGVTCSTLTGIGISDTDW